MKKKVCLTIAKFVVEAEIEIMNKKRARCRDMSPPQEQKL